jgi:hypothetical protein
MRRLLGANVEVLRYPTLKEWLEEWLPARKSLTRNTFRSYESHVRLYLVPYLGTVRLDKLHVTDMFEQIAEHNEEITAARESQDERRCAAVKWQCPVGPSSMQRIRETLRKALNDAIRQQLITFNPAKWVEMPSARRPKAMLWTVEGVELWRRTGQVPGPVMIWIPAQTGAFLDIAQRDRLYHLIAHVGCAVVGRHALGRGQYRRVEPDRAVRVGNRSGDAEDGRFRGDGGVGRRQRRRSRGAAGPAGRRADGSWLELGGVGVGVHQDRWQPDAPGGSD